MMMADRPRRAGSEPTMSSDDQEKFQEAIRRIDAANAGDPKGEAILYAMRMTGWLDRLDPKASTALRLAARAQHVRRWEIPRSTYPMTRAGYIRWRTDLGRFHAEVAGQILRAVGYDNPTVERVRSLLRKENLKEDAETQTLEDVICLVFLENYFAEFARDKDEAKLMEILRKTWRKMSPRGHAATLTIPLAGDAAALVEKALAAD
jgi:hypothetical protein